MLGVANAFNGQTGAAAGTGGMFTALMPLILIFAIFYFLLIAPQRKREKAHKEMISNLKKGDKIITGGGIYGTIVKLKKNYVEIEVDKDTKLRIQRSSISQLRREE